VEEEEVILLFVVFNKTIEGQGVREREKERERG
jgi:hypothetical protein